MGSRRSLRFILFVFDGLRLLVVVSALSAFRSLFSATGSGSLGGHAVVFAAPQALFPLLLLFSWLDPDRFESYLPMFLAGKLISAVAIGAWLLGTAQDTAMAVGLGNTGVILIAAVSAAVLLYDLASAATAAYLVRTDSRKAESAGRGSPEKDISDRTPAIVVETVDDVRPAVGAANEGPGSEGGA